MRRSSLLSRPGGTGRSSPASSLLVSSGDSGDDREDGTDSVTAVAFAAAFTAECDDDGDDDDDDMGLVIAESSSTINLDAHLTHEEVKFCVPEVNDLRVKVEHVAFDDVENGMTTTSSYRTLIESHDHTKMEEEDDDARDENVRATTAQGGFANRYLVVGWGNLSCVVTVTPTENAGPSKPAVSCLIDDLDGDLVSSSVGSLKRCIDTVNTSLSSWSQEPREYVAEIAINIKEEDTIYWVQGLCANLEKSLALGERGLEGLDRANCPSANFNDRVLKPVAAKLRAKMVFCNIRDVCIRDGVNCMCATSEEAEQMAEKKQNSSFRTAVEHLSRKH